MPETNRSYQVTLVGPSGSKPNKVRRLGPWTKIEWRKLVIELEVGSEQFPTWDAANLCMQAIQDLIKMNDGMMSDAVIDAISTHTKVISFQTFRGPV